MRTPFILALVASVALPAAPALAQRAAVSVDIRAGSQDRGDFRGSHYRGGLQAEYNQEVAQAKRQYRNDLRYARSARDRREAQRTYELAVNDARRNYESSLQNASYERNGYRDGRNDNNARDWRTYRNYDYNRPEPGQTDYYADQYYRDGSNYQERTLSRDERVYRGQDGRYYCRRSDGTTGLIIGGVAGGLFGNAISNGRSSTIGTLLGAAVGASVGASIDRNNVRCR